MTTARDPSAATLPPFAQTNAPRGILQALLPYLAIAAIAAILPLIGNEYWAVIGTRAAIYWILVCGLNLIVGYAGQLAIGYVSLLTLGAYSTSVLAAGNPIQLTRLPKNRERSRMVR